MPVERELAMLKQLTKFRSRMYSLLAYPYYREITAEYGSDLVMFLKAFAELPEDGEGVDVVSLKRSAENVLEYAQKLTTAENKERWATEFARLFLVNAYEFSVMPYESVYLSPSRLVMQNERDEVFKFYCVNKKAKQENFKEPEDHISAELSFMSAMSESAEEALASGDKQGFAASLSSQLLFLDDHILKWLPLLVSDMQKPEDNSFFARFAVLTECFVRYDRELLQKLNC